LPLLMLAMVGLSNGFFAWLVDTASNPLDSSVARSLPQFYCP
jgi:hypothetical protein